MFQQYDFLILWWQLLKMNFVAIFCIIGYVVIILYDMIVTRILLYSSLYLNRESWIFDLFANKREGDSKIGEKTCKSDFDRRDSFVGFPVHGAAKIPEWKIARLFRWVNCNARRQWSCYILLVFVRETILFGSCSFEGTLFSRDKDTPDNSVWYVTLCPHFNELFNNRETFYESGIYGPLDFAYGAYLKDCIFK